MNSTVGKVLGATLDEVSNNFGFADFTVLIVILSVSLGIGFFFGCFGDANKSTEDYLLGGRKMKTIPIAISLIASQLSGISIMSFPAEVYVYGLELALIIPLMIIVVVVLNKVFIPVFYNNYLANCYDYLELRFGKSVKSLIGGIYVLNVLLILPVTLYMPSLALAQVTNINLHLINSVCVTVCVLYTMLGGIKAVVWTDVVQASVMVGSITLTVVMGVMDVGGLGKVMEIAENGDRLDLFDWTLDLTTRQTVWNIFTGYFIMWVAYTGMNQSCIQRIVSVPSLRHAQNTLYGFLIGFIIITGLNLFVGVVMYSKYSDCDPLATGVVTKPDKMVPHFVQDVVGHLPGLTGVFVSCVFSAGLSTMSAALNSLAGLIYEDIIRKRINHSEEKAKNIMKLIIIVTGIYCILMALIVEKFSSILQMAMTISSVSTGATFGAFSLGMLWPKANKKGALYGSLISVGLTLAIIIGSQIKMLRNEIIYPILSSSTDNCTILPENVTSWISSYSVPTTNETFNIFKISFPWFPAIGSATTIVVGVVVSYLTGGNDISLTGTKLISPVAHWLVPKDIRDMELSAITAESPEEDNKSPSGWSSPEGNEDSNLQK